MTSSQVRGPISLSGCTTPKCTIIRHLYTWMALPFSESTLRTPDRDILFYTLVATEHSLGSVLHRRRDIFIRNIVTRPNFDSVFPLSPACISYRVFGYALSFNEANRNLFPSRAMYLEGYYVPSQGLMHTHTAFLLVMFHSVTFCGGFFL